MLVTVKISNNKYTENHRLNLHRTEQAWNPEMFGISSDMTYKICSLKVLDQLISIKFAGAHMVR